MKHRLALTVSAAAIVVALLGAISLGGAATSAQAAPPDQAVLDWNAYASEALLNAPTAGTPGAGEPPPVAVIGFAMMHGAVYDAVNMIDGGYEPYLDDLPPAPANASKPAAVATAAHDVLVGVVSAIPPGAIPGLTPQIVAAINARLHGLRDDSLALIPDGPEKTAGIAAGAAAAQEMLRVRANDGRFGPFRFTCGEDAGEWRPATALTCTNPSGPSDPFAWVARVEPFMLESTSQFRSKGPRALTSGAYAKEYNEVKSLGAVGSTRNPEQQALAQFFTVNPVELYNRTFRTISAAQGLTLVEEARLFAMLNLTAADTFINTWDDKAHFSFWRPITAIRLGDSDGNPRTVGDPTWTPLVGTPPYPDHSSGYNAATGSFMHAAEEFFGRKPLAFSLVRIVPGVPNVTRDYDQFADVIDDTVDARIYQGLHFRAADVASAKIGRDVAHWLHVHFFEPVR